MNNQDEGWTAGRRDENEKGYGDARGGEGTVERTGKKQIKKK